MTTLHLATSRRQKTGAHCWLAAGLSRNLVNFVKWCLVFGACVIAGSIMASMLSGLSGVKPFNVHEDRSSLGQRWNRWISQFELYVLASGVSDDARSERCCFTCRVQMFRIFSTRCLIALVLMIQLRRH